MFPFRPISPIAAAIIESLDTHPERWTANAYQLRCGENWHDPAVDLWIANRANGLEIKRPSGYSLSATDRRAVWKAFKRWRDTPRGTAEFVALLNSLEPQPQGDPS